MPVLNNLQDRRMDGPIDYLDMTLLFALGRAAGEQDWHSEVIDLPSVRDSKTGATQRLPRTVLEMRQSGGVLKYICWRDLS